MSAGSRLFQSSWPQQQPCSMKYSQPLDFIQPQNDTNCYNWGRIGDHNVVFASLSAGVYGTTIAATTASQLLTSFPQIRVGLMVGIGAAIPTSDIDVRLGDVVVSQPHGRSGGVVHYDFQAATTSPLPIRRGHLNKPPELLLKALAKLQAQHERYPSKIPEYLDIMLQNNPHMGKSKPGRPGYIYQGEHNDRLFESAYVHISGNDCSKCDPHQVVQREPRGYEEPEIHYGIIASGNTLVKDATTRDMIPAQTGEKCICVEMEAAGLMDNFPCIVIRGISDYADSHKNDRWQRYAASTAAAYAKEYLGVIPGQDIERCQLASDLLRNISEDLAVTKKTVQHQEQDAQVKKIHNWLSPPDPSVNYNAAKSKQHPGTGSWFLNSKPFQEWKAGIRRAIWLHGIPGCGKPVLASAIIENLRKYPQTSCETLDFFFDFSDPNKRKIRKMIHSLATQVYTACSESRDKLDSLWSECNYGQRQPEINTLIAVLLVMMGRIGTVRNVIDALDECDDKYGLPSYVQQLVSGESSTRIQVILISRREEELESGLRSWINETDSIQVDESCVNRDIEEYVGVRLHSAEFIRWESQPEVLQEIKGRLVEKAEGMFRWAACQLDELRAIVKLPQLRKSLDSLPKTLDETYSRILYSIHEANIGDAIRVLQFLTFTERPLTTSEVGDTLATEIDPVTTFNPDQRLNRPQDIIKICSSLVSLIRLPAKSDVKGTPMQLKLAHASVKEYFISMKLGGPFQEGLTEINARGTITRVRLTYLIYVGEVGWHRGIENIYPFLDYCCGQWMSHARMSEELDIVRDEILKFFRNASAYHLWGRVLMENDYLPFFTEGEVMAQPLYYASLVGLERTVQCLIFDGADVNAKGGPYYTALQAACHGNYKRTVKLLIASGANVNDQDARKKSALKVASDLGHTQLVNILLERGADPAPWLSGPDPFSRYEDVVEHLLGYGMEPTRKYLLQGLCRHGLVRPVRRLLGEGIDVCASDFIAACEGGNLSIIQLLLDSGISVHSKGQNGEIGLYVAAAADHRAVVNLLLDRGAKDDTESISGSALYIASLKGFTSVVESLLQHREYFDPAAVATGLAITAGNSQPLSAACHSGHEAIVRMLLEHGANINTECPEHGIPLYTAARGGHANIVRLLFEKGADIDLSYDLEDYRRHCELPLTRGGEQILEMFLEHGADINDHRGLHALSYACGLGNETLVRKLLKDGAEPNFWDGKDPGRHPLPIAANHGHQGIVQLLLENGASPNAIDRQYRSALRAAASAGYKEIVQLLLAKGANPNIDDMHQSGTVLQQVLNIGYLDIFQVLLAAGAETEVARGFDNLLRTASRNGHERIVKMLLKKGDSPDDCLYGTPSYTLTAAHRDLQVVRDVREHEAQVHTEQKAISTALQAAAVGGHETVVRLLLDAGGDPNIWEADDGSALYAATRRGREIIVRLLLAKGADPNVDQKNGRSCLQAACQGNYSSIIEALLQRGVDVNALGIFGDFHPLRGFTETTPTSSLTTACLEGHEKTASLLIDCGANVNLQGGVYGTAIQAASYSGHETIVAMLLENGADPRIEGGKYGSALCAASAQGHETIVRLLLDHGVDTNGRNPKGRTGMWFAAEEGMLNIVQLLLGHGGQIGSPDRKAPCPLLAASARGHEDIVEELLENNISRHDPPSHSKSDALFAASANNQKRVVEMLLDHGADLHAESTGRRETALKIAAAAGHKRMVQLLLDRGAKPGTGTHGFGEVLAAACEYTPIIRLLLQSNTGTRLPKEYCAMALTAAVERGAIGFVKTLLSTSVDINNRGIFERHPLEIAAKRGEETFVRVLLEHGANTTTCERALLTAVYEGHEEVVEMLLEHGMNLEHQDESGRTLLAIAAGRGNFSVVNLLSRRGAGLETKDKLLGRTPLSWAAGGLDESARRRYHERFRVVKQLLAKGANPKAQDDEGLTPLKRAALESTAILGTSPGGRASLGVPWFWSYRIMVGDVEKLLREAATRDIRHD